MVGYWYVVFNGISQQFDYAVDGLERPGSCLHLRGPLLHQSTTVDHTGRMSTDSSASASKVADAPTSSAADAPIAQANSAAAPQTPPYALLILHNIAKRKNFGEIMRSAAAMGVHEVTVSEQAQTSATRIRSTK